MAYLLDTNVISEWRKPRPDPGVTSWLQAVDEDATFISVVTVAELNEAIERVPTGRRKHDLSLWLRETLASRFEGRILSIDVQTAVIWAKIVAGARASGRRTEPMDTFIAATAAQHDLTLVTRNTKDFDFLGPPVVNPWRET